MREVKWHSRHLAAGRVDQKRDGLQRMAHDELWLGIARRLLVQALDAGHEPTLLWRLDAIGETD